MAHYTGAPVGDGPIEIRSPDFPGYAEAYTQADIDTAYWYHESVTAENMLYFAVTLTGEHVPVGEVVLHDIDAKTGEAFVHIHLFRREHRIQGLGEHALRAILGYAFRHTKLKTLKLIISEENFPARRCYAKCGFEQVDRLEGDRSRLLMVLTREQWRRMQEEEEWER